MLIKYSCDACNEKWTAEMVLPTVPCKSCGSKAVIFKPIIKDWDKLEMEELKERMQRLEQNMENLTTIIEASIH
jgi:DNA-directed RNA polymerase subunit RPC12/RpoP